MKKIFFISFVLSNFIYSQFYINPISEVVKSVSPTWMQEKLDEDFASFSNMNFSYEEAVTFLKKNDLNGKDLLFLISIKNQKVFVIDQLGQPVDPERLSNQRLQTLYLSFKYLTKLFFIKDSYYLVFLGDHLYTSSHLPVMTFAKIKTIAGICIPDFEALKGYFDIDQQVTQAANEHPFDLKIEKAFWRGSTTGGSISTSTWKTLPRSQLTLFSKTYPELCDAKFTDIVQTPIEDYSAIKQEMVSLNVFGSPLSIKDHLNYKYLIDIDGNSCTYSRLYWILKSNSLCIKQNSQHEQWYYKGIKPYIHYLPFKEDFSDLKEKIEWAKDHPDKVIEMIHHANIFSKNYLKHSDAIFYLYFAVERYMELLK